MEPVWIISGIVVFLVFVAIAFIVSSIQSAQRRTELPSFAQKHGFKTYIGKQFEEPAGEGKEEWPGGALRTMFKDFAPLNYDHESGGELRAGVDDSGDRATNAIVGDIGDRTFYFFDFRYLRTHSGGSRSESDEETFGIAAVRVPMDFSGLDIRSEYWYDKIGAALGRKDIQFPSEEFNRRYHVTSDSEKFARDVIQEEMAAFLLRAPQRHWQLRGNYLVVENYYSYEVKELEEVLQAMQDFLALIPESVRNQIAIKPTWTSPFA